MPGNEDGTELPSLSNRLGNLHVASLFVLVISSCLLKLWQKIRVGGAGLRLGISGRPPLPSTHSLALSRSKKGRVCPFSRMLKRGCDDGGEGSSAGAVNRKPGSSVQGDEPAFQGSPSITK